LRLRPPGATTAYRRLLWLGSRAAGFGHGRNDGQLSSDTRELEELLDLPRARRDREANIGGLGGAGELGQDVEPGTVHELDPLEVDHHLRSGALGAAEFPGQPRRCAKVHFP
jgi:hypothetical protein